MLIPASARCRRRGRDRRLGGARTRRRAAWMAGPSEEEKQDGRRRYRWRATLGLEESRLGPAQEDIDRWAEREHRRRAAWLAGPTDAEKQGWVRRQRRRRTAGMAILPCAEGGGGRGLGRARAAAAQQWLPGPSEEESRSGRSGRPGGLVDELMTCPGLLEAISRNRAALPARSRTGRQRRPLRSVARAPGAVVVFRARRKGLRRGILREAAARPGPLLKRCKRASLSASGAGTAAGSARAPLGSRRTCKIEKTSSTRLPTPRPTGHRTVDRNRQAEAYRRPTSLPALPPSRQS